MTALGRPVTPNGDTSPTTATSPRKQSAVLGTLIVVVLRAKNLTNRVRIGKQNPYCTITYGLNKKRTETIERGGQQPTWDAEFRFELLRDERDQLGGDGANALVNKHGGVMPLAAASEQAKLQAAQTTASATSSNGKRVLKLACYADDVKDPKLVGEGVLELDETIKKGAFDDWVKLERKGRYSGEIYLELTWYSSDPPPERPPQRHEPLGAYGGPGSRTDDYSDDDRNTEDWDGSEVGPSPGALDVAADYPDPDLAPLSQSMSTLSVNQRPPLPAPPPSSSYQRQPSYGYGPPFPQNGSYQQPLDRRESYAGGPGGSYGPPPSNYGGGADEFGGYGGAQHGGDNQATIGASTQGRVSGFQQLANQHYASQGYRSDSYDQPPQQYQQLSQQQQYVHPPPPPPPPPQIYESPPPQQQGYAPPQPNYQLPPQPPQPPATPSHWQQQPSNPLPQPPRPHSSASGYDYGSISSGSHLHHSPSVSSFAPPPNFSGPPLLQQPTPPTDYNHQQFAPPQSFAPPPPQPPSFNQFPPAPPPPQPLPSRYSTGTPLPIPPAPPSSNSFYSSPAPPQPPIPPPSLQNQQGGYHQQPLYEQYDHSSEPQDYNYPPPPQQQQGGGAGGYYAPAPPVPPPSMQQGGYGVPLPQPPVQQYQAVGAGSYNPYGGQQQW